MPRAFSWLVMLPQTCIFLVFVFVTVFEYFACISGRFCSTNSVNKEISSVSQFFALTLDEASIVDVFDRRQVWNHGAKVLMFIGEDDKCGIPDSGRLLQQHYPRDQRHNFQLVSYPEAGHLLEPPYTVLCSLSYHKVYKISFLFGGHPRSHADAQEDSWRRTIKFFKEHIQQPVSNGANSNL